MWCPVIHEELSLVHHGRLVRPDTRSCNSVVELSSTRSLLLLYAQADARRLPERPASTMVVATLSALCLGACDVDATDLYDKVLAKLSDQKYTYSKAVMRTTNLTGFGANPGNPYVVYDDMPEQSTLLGVPYWKMRPKDAVLFIGCTPPAAAYFSWRSYLFRGGGDRQVFASMGDSSNNLAVQTQGSSASARIAVVTTGDSTTYADVSSALDIAGLGSATNLDQVELALFDGESAEYTMLHRASVWSNSTARKECPRPPGCMLSLPAALQASLCRALYHGSPPARRLQAQQHYLLHPSAARTSPARAAALEATSEGHGPPRV